MKYICTDEILNIRKKWYANKKPVIFEDLCSNISPKYIFKLVVSFSFIMYIYYTTFSSKTVKQSNA